MRPSSTSTALSVFLLFALLSLTAGISGTGPSPTTGPTAAGTAPPPPPPCCCAGAGGAAHLPGMTAALTALPVLGVPVESAALNGLDSLLSIVQMPGGVPVATFAIGKAGAINAGLFAAAIVAGGDARVAKAWRRFRAEQTAKVRRAKLP